MLELSVDSNEPSFIGFPEVPGCELECSWIPVIGIKDEVFHHDLKHILEVSTKRILIP